MAFSTSARFPPVRPRARGSATDRKSTRLNSSHLVISYAVFCLKKKKKKNDKSLHNTSTTVTSCSPTNDVNPYSTTTADAVLSPSPHARTTSTEQREAPPATTH